MIDKAELYIEKYHMVKSGDHVIAGVSGGADSVCLFLILERLQKTMDFSMSVVHIEHGMRGEESKRDQKFVVNLVQKYGVDISCYTFQITEVAKIEKCSLEEAGRIVRYQAFEEEARKYMGKGIPVKIAVAHHSNDNAETLLFHMCRGTGVLGLSGIRPVRDKIIRPLLCFTRWEIELFLQKEHQDYCTDDTNTDIRYSRNKIRHEVIPALLQINQGTVEHLNQVTEDMAEIGDYLETQVSLVWDTSIEEKKDGSIVCYLEKWKDFPNVIKKAAALRMIHTAAGNSRDISREHVQKLLELSEGQVGRRLSLPYQLIAEKSYGILNIHRKKCKVKEKALFGEIAGNILEVDDQGCVITPAGELHYRIILNSKNYEEIPKNRCTKWFDYDKISDMLCFRTRESGDFFTLDKGGSRQKIKDYFINEKVPRKMRDDVVLLTEGHHVLWAVGYRISEYYKISGSTKRILEVQFMEERT